MPKMMAEVNRLVFEKPSIVKSYNYITLLTAAEQIILRDYGSFITGGRVLDLGVGAGRTAAAFSEGAASYVGVDYSEAMIQACKRRFPHLHFRVGDARRMPELSSAAFDFVLFSFNGLDFVGKPDRLQILNEVNRVLCPGGVFMFSSHSLDFAEARPFLSGIRDPARPGVSLQGIRAGARAGRKIFNYVRNMHMQRRGQDEAILIDPGHDYRLPTYYIRKAAQLRQLREVGFTGSVRVLPEHPPGGWLMHVPYSYYYVVRKTA